MNYPKPSVCLACKSPLPVGAGFCMYCGSRALDSGRELPKVHKLVSVLYSDVVGSTLLFDKCGPHAADAIMQRFFEKAEEVVTRYGGWVQSRAGDEVMALFGVPVLYGDDAVRAVRAALGLRDMMIKLNPDLRAEWDVELRLRTAVHTDSLEVPEGVPRRIEVVTPLTTVGKRLQTSAEPGEVLISAATHQLVRDAVHVEPVGALRFKGLPAPMHAVKVLELKQPVPIWATPLVGRVRELALLNWAYDRVVSQRSCFVVYVLGERGAGKTRLVDEYARGLAGRTGGQPLVLRGACLPYGSAITYHPFRQILRRAANIVRGDASHVVRAKLAKLVNDDPSITARLAPLLGLPESPGEPEDTAMALQRALTIIGRRTPLGGIVKFCGSPVRA